jgi:hypothetical protein
MAAPAVTLQFFRLFHPNRIRVKIADQLQKVGVPVIKNRFVPSLEEEANGPVTPVIVEYR